VETAKDFLLRTGMINATVFAGIQPDDCVVWRKLPSGYQNFSLCNHSCVTEANGKPTGGNYICDASFVFADGAKARFAPQREIVNWTKTVAVAQALARDMFFAKYSNHYCEEFKIPRSWACAIQAEITSADKKVEVNRFGGSPEMLPDCAGIIADCKEAGMVVNLTSPGRRFMTDKQFVQDIALNPPNILALSFDDMESVELTRIAKMDLDAIKSEWKTVSPLFGQRQKAYEGIYASRLMRDMGVPIKILFNVVIHPGNVGHLDDILATITECVPGSFANPYPAQSFGCESSCWTSESLPALRSHVLNFITGTLEGRQGVTKRLHYYIVLEAAFRRWSDNPKRLCEFMSGIGAWDFTLRPGAYRYAQIGKNMEVLNVRSEELPLPGGHLGCFWNPILGLPEYVHNSSLEETAETLLTGMVKRGQQLATSQLCPLIRKSNIMPRLMFDMVATELGLPYDLVPEYLATRQEYAGF
jgi:hypothetical protein